MQTAKEVAKQVIDRLPDQGANEPHQTRRDVRPGGDGVARSPGADRVRCGAQRRGRPLVYVGQERGRTVVGGVPYL